MTRTPGSPGAQTDPPTTGVDHRRFWKVLERFAGTLVQRFELDQVLRQLGADITRVLDMAGAGVMLGDEDGNLRFTSTSDDVLHKLEGLQIELDEGPCLLAYRTAQTVLAEDLRDDARFTEFGPRAVEAGMAAVYSFPMRIDQDTFGALNLYRSEPGPFSVDQAEVGGVFADVATCYLINARDVEQKDLLTKQLQHALTSRVVIEQAKGLVSGQLDIDLPDAFEAIRSYARSHQITVRMVAGALVHRDLAAADLVAG